MQVEQDYFEHEQTNKNKRIITAISIALIIVVISIIGVIILLLSMSKSKLSITIDGVSVKVPEDTFIITNERKNICINKGYCTICRI